MATASVHTGFGIPLLAGLLADLLGLCARLHEDLRALFLGPADDLAGAGLGAFDRRFNHHLLGVGRVKAGPALLVVHRRRDAFSGQVGDLDHLVGDRQTAPFDDVKQ